MTTARASQAAPAAKKAARPAAASAAPQAGVAPELVQGRPFARFGACACGGGCPRCAPRAGIGPIGDAEEQRADRVADGLSAGASAPARNAAPAIASALEGLGPGQPLDRASREFFEPRFGRDLSAVRIHDNAAADRRARQIDALAFNQGLHIAFRSGQRQPHSGAGRWLMAHELAHLTAAPTRHSPGPIRRHPVEPVVFVRRTRTDLFGDGTPLNLGTSVGTFDTYTREQADWFAEPTLTTADRTLLWELMLHLQRGSHVMAGVGDLRLSDLVGRSAADWTALENFGRACDPGHRTVRIASAGAYTVARRISIGNTLAGMESLHNMSGEVLEITVSEIQLDEVDAGGTLPAITDYWTRFHPHLQTPIVLDPAPARGPEFQRVLDMLAGLGGITPFATLLGRIRNLHRFSRVMLTRLVANYADRSRSRPVQLVLHTGHDSGAFQDSAPLFEDLVMQTAPPGWAGLFYDERLVLVLEGGDSLAAMSVLVADITRDYGQLDSAGTPRLEQAMIAGHGSPRSVQMAGTGAPQVHSGEVRYSHSESLAVDASGTPTPDTAALLDSLLRSLDPATARLVFAGCLVASNPVPAGTPTGAISAYIAVHPNLADVVESRGLALGLPVDFVSASRASLGLSGARSLRDDNGELAVDVRSLDPHAFGDAMAYAASGLEPEGVLVAAVELAGNVSATAAAAALQARIGLPARPTSWYDEMTRVVVSVALDGVPVGGAVDVNRVNILAHLVSTPFLARWSNYGVGVSTFVTEVNVHAALAPLIYAGIAATSMFTAPPDLEAKLMHFMVDQAWMNAGTAREAQLLAFLDADAGLTATVLAPHLDTGAIAANAATLFPPGAAASSGRLRLALAWLRRDPAQPDMLAFLNSQVVTGAGAPSLTAALRAELNGLPESSLLASLGVSLTPTTTTAAAGGGAAVTMPFANADVTGDTRTDVLVEQQPYEATVLPVALNVRRRPTMAGVVIDYVRRGDIVRVVGFTHDWAAIEKNGRLGFVYRTQISAPPP